MTYTEKELDQFLHGISLSLLSKKSAQHWRYDEETAKEIEWLEALERKVRADKADRKTEPIPHDDYIETENDHLEARCLNCNNAKACKEKHWEGCVYEPKDEKACETCKYWKYIAHEWQCETTKCQGYTPNTKPQTDEHLQRLQMCVDCEHTDMCEWCSRWSKDEPQTVDLGNGFSITANDCDTCKHRDKPFDDLPCDMCCKAHSGYEPKDEPQTERSE